MNIKEVLNSFPATPLMHSYIKSRVWFGIMSAELKARYEKTWEEKDLTIKVFTGKGEFDPMSVHTLSYIGDFENHRSRSFTESVIQWEYYYGICDMSEPEFFPERVWDYLAVFGDPIYNELKLSVPEGERPSVVYFSWMEVATINTILNSGYPLYNEIPLSAVLDSMTVFSSIGFKLARNLNSNAKFKEFVFNQLPSDQRHILDENCLNRAMIIYGNISEHIKGLKKESFLDPKYKVSDPVNLIDPYVENKGIVGIPRLIDTIYSIQQENDRDKVIEINSLMDGFKGLIKDGV